MLDLSAREVVLSDRTKVIAITQGGMQNAVAAESDRPVEILSQAITNQIA